MEMLLKPADPAYASFSIISECLKLVTTQFGRAPTKKEELLDSILEKHGGQLHSKRTRCGVADLTPRQYPEAITILPEEH